ncbi:MAG TPA: sulfate ABC transporter substrate-binding protein [Actinomycetota bacterium]|nr:sulfate ABC transporter substrate-binding protein [Actinomycetota bacterium]
MRLFKSGALVGALAALSLTAAACGGSSSAEPDGNAAAGDCKPAETPVITFAAYSTPREAYGKIISAFQAKWKEEHNDQQVIFQESYGGSTTQAQNVINGFPADIVALSLGPDVDAIADEGLITHDWTQQPDGGMVSTSVVVLDVRPGNPQNIDDFDDLAKPGIEVLTPDPAASGGARWNIVGAYGAAMRGYAGNDKGDQAGAQELLEGIFANVTVLDKTARDSIKNFESGNGDVAITYENEILTAQKAGLEDEMVIPPSTILIENPVAVVDKNSDKHCVTPVAEAFVDFLHTKEAKELYTTVGFLRSTDKAAAQKGTGGYRPVEDLFTVDDFGGWPELNQQLFSAEGIFTKAFAESQS